MTDDQLLGFIAESNKIEGIFHDPKHDFQAHRDFLDSNGSISALEDFVTAVQPGAVLRDKPGMNVQVGRYVAPPGGPQIRTKLREVLAETDPWTCHCKYETLHPFMDGNGRSGRVLWLKLMGEHAPLNFLHTFYYQTLGAIHG